MRTGITALYLENFKGISEKVKIPLKPITMLFGANSAGKSTILQALLYTQELLERRNPNADKTVLGGDAVDLGGFRNLVNGHDISKSVTIGFDICPNSDGVPHYAELFEVLLTAVERQYFEEINLSPYISAC